MSFSIYSAKVMVKANELKIAYKIVFVNMLC